MSGFAVWLSFDESPDPEQVAAVAADIAHRGPDRREAITTGPCTLIHAALWTTPEASTECQPQRHVGRDVWLVGDARIDNHDELRSLLGPGVRQPLVTDADFILAAYERWGDDCVDRLIGEFGFAVWDGERQALLVARDHIGIRPVCYARLEGGLVVASTIGAVAAALPRPLTVDEDYLAGYLAGLPPRDRSFWNEVQYLAGGHQLSTTANGTRVVRYWEPSLAPIRQSLDETVAQVRAVVDEAVGARLREHGGVVACELSGGFDSSTVAATAARLDADCRALGLAYRVDPEADEVRHITEVAEHLDVPLDLVEADGLPAIDPREYARRHREPLCGVDADGRALYDLAHRHGSRVILNGVGGDEALYGEEGAPRHPVRLARQGAKRVALAVGGSWAERTVRDRYLAARPWLATYPPLAADRTLRPRGVAQASWSRYRRYTSAPWNPTAYLSIDRLTVEREVEARYPLLDRRLIELVLRLPETQLRLGGAYRGLHRLAFADRLPDSILNREDKADLARPYMRRVLEAFDRESASTALEALGDRVDAVALMHAYDRGLDAFDGRPGQPSGFDLWYALSAGVVLQEL